MSEKQQAVVPVSNDEGWRSKTLMIGGLVGGLIGLFSAYLYVRAAEETNTGEAPSPPQTGDAVKLGISLLTIIRTIADWGHR